MASFTISLDNGEAGFWEDSEGDVLCEVGMDREEFLNGFGLPDQIDEGLAMYCGDGLIVRFDGDEVAEFTFLANSLLDGVESAICRTDKGVDATSTFREAARKHPHAIAVLGGDGSRVLVYREGYIVFRGNDLSQIGLSRSGVAGFAGWEPL